MTSTVLVIGESVEFIYCDCKCGFTRSKYDRDGYERKYILGHRAKCDDHPMLGKPRSQETRKKISEGNKGERNHGWKGDDVSKRALHSWIRKYFPSPELCHM
jgi:hypothetical protein